MLIIGHRGVRGHAAENTLDSFQKAILMNVDGIEFDVHLSSDGEIIVIHDETVDRTTNGSGPVKEMSVQQLQKLTINGKYSIPVLAEVIDLADHKLLLNIELKSADAAVPVVKLVEKYIANKRKYDQFLISSFDWNALQHVRELNTDIPLGVLTYTDIDLAIGFAEFIQAETIHPHFHLLNAANTAEMQRKGFKVFTWTVNEREDILKIKSFKPDGIITDF
ncbi:MAG TPA: glycerophosphodiester phosphodiesterase family protein, partial [Flavobacterium sp.]|nr:glycerophosphodiester phosphodiesterase family protein [Flavobacterium sp.]